jgi:hypothetical protein
VYKYDVYLFYCPRENNKDRKRNGTPMYCIYNNPNPLAFPKGSSKKGKREKRQLLSIMKPPAPFSNERITGQKKQKNGNAPETTRYPKTKACEIAR